MTHPRLVWLSGILLLVGCGAGETSPREHLEATVYVYGEWNAWSECNAACGAGHQTRTRGCFTEDGVEAACAFCGGECQESTACEGTAGCSYSYSAWGYYSDCSAACGGGTETRSRTCVRGDGVEVDCGLCGGGCSESRVCNDVAACAYSYGAWQTPGDCSNTCGAGVRTRSRECLASGGGSAACAECGGNCTDSIVCSDVSGCTFSYTGWGGFGTCSATCGEGERRRRRECVRSDGRAADCSSCGGDCVDVESCTATSGCPTPDGWAFTVSSIYSNYTGHHGTQTRSGGGLSDGVFLGATSIWGSNGGDEPWIQADFGREVYVSSVLLAGIDPSFGWGVYYLSYSDLEYSLDGVNWTYLQQVPGLNEAELTELSADVLARYVRLKRTGVQYMGLSEFSFR